LVVGAGGIGCELLKNLVLTGFTQIEVIDLDTIELSNLNRQFLFQKVHVGKSKALTAKESVLKYNPKATITAYHDTVMSTKYNVEFFQQFAIVLNALDNKAARSHVNRLCLAANVPLVESGSAGYLGQVTLIKKGLTECYDCLPKPPVKSFPGCTIRNTPSEPIHCIVWAKHLFNQLFGAEDPDEAVSPDGEDPENMQHAGQTAADKDHAQEAVLRVSTRQWAKETSFDEEKIFNKLFNDDIKYLLSMSKLWEARKPPVPLDWKESCENHQTTETTPQSGDKISSLRLWSVSECCRVFADSVKACHIKLEQAVANNEENPILCWDKDEEDGMNFVTAAANLRCFIFSIGIKSKFEVKSLAGNIIPAIATTNAIVAGLIVIQALKVLKNELKECKTVYLRDKAIKSRVIVGTELCPPNEKCYVCAEKAEISVKLNMQQFTIKQFETKILKLELGMVQPDVEIDDGTGRIIISSEEGETEANNEKALSFFGLGDQSSLKCDDFFQNFELKIKLYQCDKFDAQSGKDYELISDNQMLKDIQQQLKKENTKVSAATTVVTTELAAEKKRRYEQAFADDNNNNNDDETSSTSNQQDSNNQTKKLKQSPDEATATNNVSSVNLEKEEVTSCASNSINDASDALSDEENYEPSKKTEDILADDDCIIEEEECTNGHGVVMTTVTKITVTSNDVIDDDGDDDVIECSSNEDIIEINEDISQNKLNEHSEEAIAVDPFKHKKILAANNLSLNGQNNGNGHFTSSNGNGNGNGKLITHKEEDEDDGVTLID
jgi:ubiquitin-like 1-activating enzyme E1 B